jgi:hypothetical protein
MSCPIFNLEEFLLCYPEFDCFEDVQLNAVAKQANLLYSGFGGLLECDRELGYQLAVAHLATLRFNPLYAGGAIKTIKNRNDTIQYANTGSTDAFGFDSTVYGQMLKKLYKKTSFLGAFVSSGYGEPFASPHGDCCC